MYIDITTANVWLRRISEDYSFSSNLCNVFTMKL